MIRVQQMRFRDRSVSELAFFVGVSRVSQISSDLLGTGANCCHTPFYSPQTGFQIWFSNDIGRFFIRHELKVSGEVPNALIVDYPSVCLSFFSTPIPEDR